MRTPRPVRSFVVQIYPTVDISVGKRLPENCDNYKMYVLDGRFESSVGLAGISPCLRKCPRVVWFILFGILVMVFVGRWILYTEMREMANGNAPKRMLVRGTSPHLETSTTTQRAITHTVAASNSLEVLNGTNPARNVNNEQGSSTPPPPQSSIVNGQSGVSCKEVRNATKAAEAGKYVSLSPSHVDSRRLGNQLFNLAAVLMVARLTQRTPFFPAGWLDNAFDLGVDRIIKGRTGHRICPCYTFHEKHSMYFDERLADLGEIPEKGLLLSGYFQSWKYLKYVENELRCRLVFREKVRKEAERFLVEHKPTEWEVGTYERIGVHVRRGDFLQPRRRKHGYTTPTMTYFRSAIDYFRKRHSRIHLVLASDDLAWTKENFVKFQTSNVSVTFSENNTGPVDLAILTCCHSLVLSSGTFGWWAAWLANVTTVYLKDWPKPGSPLESHLSREDFFPPQWIAL